MLPLSADAFPQSSAALAAALERGFAQHGIVMRDVTVTGEGFPAIDELAIDLTGASLSRNFRVPGTRSLGEAVRVESLRIAGNPVRFENTPVTLQFAASQAVFEMGGEPGNGSLNLAEARDGTVLLSVSKDALEALLHEYASRLAASKGIEIATTQVRFASHGPRSLSFVAEVTAKVFVMTAAVTLSGNLDLDDRLTARVSGLRLGGDGMVTRLAGSYVQPQLDKIEGRTFPLLAFSPAGLKLRDVEISAGDVLEIKAVFGSA